MVIMVLGVLLVFGGILYMARAAIWRGSMSGSGSSEPHPSTNTLEPPRRGLKFLGLSANWPGLAMMALGAILLLSARGGS